MPERSFFIEGLTVDRLLEIPLICCAIALIWIKPLSYTIRSMGKNKKQWVYYWMVLAGISWIENNLIPDFTYNRYILYYSLKAVFCFLLGDPLNSYLFDIKPFRQFKTSEFSENEMSKIKDGFDHEVFKRLIKDESYLSKNADKLEHPWATPPDRITSLIIARIGILASDEMINDTDYGRICKLGILETLVGALKSSDKAKSDNALLALLYMT